VRRPKYKNRRFTDADGIKWDSHGEARRWAELQLLERAGQIRNLERQVRIPLVVNGQRICAVVGDFMFFEGRKRVLEDHKSEVTRKLPVWRLKKKLLAALYPAIEIREHTKGK
jgi:hypothetical protein